MAHTRKAIPAVDLDLLPHLAGCLEGPPAPNPWGFGPWQERRALLEQLPPRVRPLLLCEFARSVLPIWVRHSATDTRPQQAIEARVRWCLLSTSAGAAHAADAAHAAHAADAANAARAAHAAGAAGAADAAHAARAADAAGAAGAADAAQWRWTHRAYLAARPVPWRPEWNTSDVLALARGIFDALAFDRMPILADALQDAGCDDEAMLSRLRDTSPGNVFTRADAALWTPMGLGE